MAWNTKFKKVSDILAHMEDLKNYSLLKEPMSTDALIAPTASNYCGSLNDY